MSNDLLNGNLEVKIPAQKLSAAQSRATRERFHNGEDVPNWLRYNCHIALAVKRALHNGKVDDNGKLKHDCIEESCGFYVNGKFYVPNRMANPQFGKDNKNLGFLSFGLVDAETGTQITCTWLGDDVPIKMINVAISHDMGENIRGSTILVPLENAIIKTQKKYNDSRKNHDTDKNGNRRERQPRHHNRLSLDDKRERDSRLNLKTLGS